MRRFSGKTISILVLPFLFFLGLLPCASEERLAERKQRLIVADCTEIGMRSAGEAGAIATEYLYKNWQRVRIMRLSANRNYSTQRDGYTESTRMSPTRK
jgi:hypothetical protein